MKTHTERERERERVGEGGEWRGFEGEHICNTLTEYKTQRRLCNSSTHHCNSPPLCMKALV